MSKRIKRIADMLLALMAGVISTLLAHTHYFAASDIEHALPIQWADLTVQETDQENSG